MTKSRVGGFACLLIRSSEMPWVGVSHLLDYARRLLKRLRAQFNTLMRCVEKRARLERACGELSVSTRLSGKVRRRYKARSLAH